MVPASVENVLLVVLRRPADPDLDLGSQLRELSASSLTEGVYFIPDVEGAFDAARSLTDLIERAGGLALLGRGSILGPEPVTPQREPRASDG